MKHERDFIMPPMDLSFPRGEAIANAVEREITDACNEWMAKNNRALPSFTLAEAGRRGVAKAIREHRGQQ